MPHPSRTICFALWSAALCLIALEESFSATATSVREARLPDPCGTWRVLEPVTGERQLLAVRPPAGAAQQVFSPHFVVHYGADSLDAYAQSVSDAAELTYRTLVDTLAHLAPLPDGTAGGDARVDIYLRPWTVMGSAYGTTYPETNVFAPYPNSYTAWVELVDTMGVARRVSVTAHEVYHTIHFVYDRNESGSLFEMLATWVQDRIYDQYNLHYDFARLFFRQPHRGLFSQFYTNVPWAIYLCEKYGDGILKEALVGCAATAGPNPREAFDAALTEVAGTTFLDEFVEFGSYNYYVGARDDGMHYSEGAAYFTTTVENRSLCYPHDVLVSPHQAGELGANYMLLDGDGHSGPLKLYIYPEYLAATILTMTRFKGATQSRSTSFYPKFSAPIDSLLINDWAECDSILMVYQVETGGSLNSFAYAARHTSAALPSGDWILVFDRDECRAPFDGIGDEFLDRDSEDTPIVDALEEVGATVVVEDALPADLSSCRGIFLVGGFGSGGVNVSDADLDRLTAFMDAGGDVYVEGSRLGEFMDGTGTASQQAFWNRFSVSFQAGAPSGNLALWDTGGNAFMGTHQFGYDAGNPNAYVGLLTPLGNAGYLVRDGASIVRMTALRAAGGSSTRIMSTVLLGGSTGLSGSTRTSFMNDVLMLFDTNVAALAVSRATVGVRDRDVAIDGVLEHYDERALALTRVDSRGRHDVALQVRRVGGEWRFSARDRLETGAADYQLMDVENARVLWRERVEARTPDYVLRLTGIYPNPARDDVRIAVDSPSDGRATIGVYDVAGREVAREPAVLRRGSNVLYFRSLPAASGVYFVHVDAPAGTARGRLLVLR
jgi:hypothetical protein